MSEEDFLKRWSRRKREVAKEEAQQTRAPETAEQTPAPPADHPDVPFDPASLPSLESITELTDIKGFLREGVPAGLTRAALRRVWTADPSIRDFVGLAENAWDFTDPNAIPGFGPLEATDDVRRLVARIVGEIGQSERSGISDASEHTESSSHSNTMTTEASEASPAPEEQPKQSAAHDAGDAPVTPVLPHGSKEDIASQHDVTKAQEKPKQISHRAHGGALPQ